MCCEDIPRSTTSNYNESPEGLVEVANKSKISCHFKESAGRGSNILLPSF